MVQESLQAGAARFQTPNPEYFSAIRAEKHAFFLKFKTLLGAEISASYLKE